MTVDRPGLLAGAALTVVGINYAPEPTGIGPYTAFMAMTLAEAGASVHVITGVPHYPAWHVDHRYRRGLCWREQHDEVRVTRLRHAVPKRANLVGRARHESTFTALATATLLRDRGDAVIAVTPSLAGLAAASAGSRRRPVGAIVQDLTGAGAEQSGTAGGRVARGIASAEYRLLRRCCRVGVIADGFAPELVANGVGADRIVHLPNFSRVQLVTIDRDDARASLGWPAERFTVVHTGNMGMKQGLGAVVEAARLMPEVDFVLVGDGNQRPELEQRATGVPNLRIIPPVADREYAAVLAAADVLLLCERAGVGTMALPSKITSYVAARRPILAAVTAGGLTDQELTRLGIGHVVPASDAEALVAGVDRLRNDHDLVAGLVSAQCRAHDLYGPARAADRYVSFAATLLDRTVPPPAPYTVDSSTLEVSR